MNDYYLRCVESDVSTLIALGVILHALVVTHDDAGQQVITAPGGALSVIGQLPDLVTGEPLRDPAGAVYWHANLRTPVDLRATAEALAAARPEIAAGLATIGRYFVVDAAGAAVPPASPRQVWL
jgi:hypothetical protein